MAKDESKKTSKKITTTQQQRVGKKTTVTRKNQPAQKKTNSVTIPSNMSVRAKEKVSVLNTDLDEYLRTSALYVSYVSGACFILVGVAMLLAHTLYPSNTLQLASTVHSTDDTFTADTSLDSRTDDDTTKETAETNSTEDTNIKKTDTIVVSSDTEAYPDPIFNLETTIPDELGTDLVVNFFVDNTKSVDVHLTYIEANKRIPLSHAVVRQGVYETVLSATQLEPGSYRMIVVLRNLNDGTLHTFPTPKFIVSKSETDSPEISYGVTAIPDTSTESASDSKEPVSTTFYDADQSIAEPDEPIIVTNDTSEDLEFKVEEDINEQDTEEPSLITDDIKKRFRLQEPNLDIVSGNATLILYLPGELTSAEVYARPTNALRAQYIGRAIKGREAWYVHFDSSNLPNAEYEFFAVSSYKTRSIESNSVIREVHNRTAVTVVDEETTVVDPLPDSPMSDDQTYLVPRGFQIEKTDEFNSDDLIDRKTKQILQNDDLAMQELFRRYAIAVQAGDETVVRITEDAIESKRKELSLQALRDGDTAVMADNIDRRLSERLSETKQRVVTFERLRSERSAGVAAQDTDEDGVSDIDEQLLYNTDPGSADTDNDGVTDGVEIGSGFDPTDPTRETSVTFESPKETTGVVRDDVLVVESVKPVVEHAETKEVARTTAVIRGRALPNSYVTLHIFSTPTVVTVRTDADGGFEYTFDKELADGTHEVYVAMTDNTGRIVAQSNPFSFVKEAQAFTPIDAAETQPVTPLVATDSRDGSSYNLVVGLSVLSFGLILLMLGVTLRRQVSPVTNPNETALS